MVYILEEGRRDIEERNFLGELILNCMRPNILFYQRGQELGDMDQKCLVAGLEGRLLFSSLGAIGL